MTSRRRFIRWMPVAAAAGVAGFEAAAQAPMLSETDPQAAALGYVADAKRANKAKFPRYAPGQHCAACQLYQGPPTAAAAPCTLFAGKQVAGPGWCSAFVPRAA